MKHISIALLLVILLASAGLMVGQYPVSFTGLMSGDEIQKWVLLDIRLVRVLLAIICGAGLGIAGAAMQGLVRNNLAEPGVLGLSAGAALAAVLVYYLGGGIGYGVALAAIAGAVLAGFAVLMLAASARQAGSLVLAGVAVSSLAGAAITLVLSLMPNPFALADLTFWLMGSLADRSWLHVAIAAPCVLAGMAIIMSVRNELALLGFGEDVALSRGVNIANLRLKIIIAAALITGGTVAVAGVIGFVGLMAPHMVRPWCGYHPARILLPSAIMGALLLLASDLAVRVLPLPSGELRIGVVTALMGAPIFLLILLRGRK